MTPQLRREVDAMCEKTRESRTAFIEAALHERLERLRQQYEDEG